MDRFVAPLESSASALSAQFRRRVQASSVLSWEELAERVVSAQRRETAPFARTHAAKPSRDAT
jgi:hypothetical protein